MDIFNRTPNISEDTLYYSLYPSANSSDRASVASLALLIEDAVNSLLPNHIWHRDVFELRAVPDKSISTAGLKSSQGEKEASNNDERWMLEGQMRVGDSVDDEWLVVWLLREISSRYDVAIRVHDSDGEFLLIEAAEQLPSWITPENSENRVWIYRSSLHLVPLSYQSPPSTRPKSSRQLGRGEDENLAESDGDDWLCELDALKAVRESVDTVAPKEVQDAVWRRISGYPQNIRQHTHVTKAVLPIDVAKALAKKPSLVQKAVETFYTRDALQLRAANRMTRFPPRPDVLTPVRMTRTAYAQLMGQKFHPPKVFGQFKEREGTKEWRWRDIGMKIACGFEMLYQESKSNSNVMHIDAQTTFNTARRDALRKNSNYVAYIEKLRANGYFRNELEGSLKWNNLEDRAAEVYVNMMREEEHNRPSFAKVVNDCVAQAGEISYFDSEEDSDDWLNINAETLDMNLAEAMQRGPLPEGQNNDKMQVDEEDEENRMTQVQADKLKDLASKVENFVEGKGSLEGAIFEDEISDDNSGSDLSGDELLSDREDHESRITNEDTAQADAARQEAMEKLVPSLDPSDYGKMPPSFYQNSQATAPVNLDTERRETTGSVSAGHNEGKAIRRPIFPRDEFDGVDSDDETDEELRVLGEGNVAEEDNEESDEDRPQVVGAVEIDMEEEQEEFLEFSRTQLGISDEMWNDILSERRKRGAFVPKQLDTKKKGRDETKTKSVAAEANADQEKGLRVPKTGPRPNVNPNLDSFETVMEAMEAELSKARMKSDLPSRNESTNKKGKATMHDADEGMDMDDSDLVKAMDEELHAALDREDSESGDEEPMDYGMIRNFLESYKSQAGLAGPVSNLAGRLEPNWTIPRDM